MGEGGKAPPKARTIKDDVTCIVVSPLNGVQVLNLV
jgi:hypothetical protein